MLVPHIADNHLFALARRSQRLPHIAIAIVMVFVFALLLQVVVGILLFVAGASWLFADPSSTADPISAALIFTAQLLVSFAPALAALWLWLRVVERRPFWTLGLEQQGAASKYGRGALAGAAMFGAAVALMAVLGFIAPENGDPRQQGAAALGGVLLVLVGWAVQGATEEILTRGWLMGVVGARYGPWRGVLVSSVVFALLHSLNPNLSALAVVNLFLFGLVAALYVLWEGGLWGICALHSVWNWVQGNVFGLEVSGQSAAGGILFNLQERGPDFVTGGPFGPEAGFAVTVVLFAIVALLVVLLCKKGEGRI